MTVCTDLRFVSALTTPWDVANVADGIGSVGGSAQSNGTGDSALRWNAARRNPVSRAISTIEA
jgi:hypothetical protein